MGTSGAMSALQCISRNIDINKKTLKSEKAFDSVEHTVLFNIVQETGLNRKNIHFLKKSYWYQIASVRVGEDETNEIPIQRVFQQEFVLSGLLFNRYSSHIFDKPLQVGNNCIKLNGINNQPYPDDTTIITDNNSTT